MAGKHTGFSLVELAAVLVIISLIAGAGISLGGNAIKGADKLATLEKLAIIKKALNQFAQQNGYLPCPADRTQIPTAASFGTETRTGGTSCSTASGVVLDSGTSSVYIGIVPIRTLGLPDSFAADAWNDKFTYAVSSGMIARPGSYNAALAAGLVMRYGALGTYQVAYRSPVGSGSTYTNYVAFAVISHGPNALGAYALDGSAIINTCGGSTIDTENCNDDYIFHDSKYSDGTQSAQFFDDYVVWGTNLNGVTAPSTNIYRTAPVGCSNVTASTPYCEPWCASCNASTANMPLAPASFTNPVLCGKVLNNTGSCFATCVWGGLVTTGSKYQPCP